MGKSQVEESQVEESQIEESQIEVEPNSGEPNSGEPSRGEASLKTRFKQAASSEQVSENIRSRCSTHQRGTYTLRDLSGKVTHTCNVHIAIHVAIYIAPRVNLTHF